MFRCLCLFAVVAAFMLPLPLLDPPIACAEQPNNPVGEWRHEKGDKTDFVFKKNGTGTYSSILGPEPFTWRLHKGGKFDGKLVYITFKNKNVRNMVGLLRSGDQMLIKNGSGVPNSANADKYNRIGK